MADARAQSWRRRWVRRGRWLAIPAALPVLAVVAFYACVWLWPYPQWLDHPPVAGTWLEDRNGVPLAAFVGADDQWHVPLTQEQISPHLLAAVVAVEDRRFFEHHGVDWSAAASAAWQNVTSFRVVRGASTLTMQVHRLREPRDRSFWWKFEQTVRAVQIEKRLTKEQILTEYVNRAPFGGNLVGAGAASWRYFGKPCRELSLGQAALLAGLPQSPNRYRPDRFPARAAKRRDCVLDRMLACGMITAEQAAEARREPLNATWRELPQARDAHHPPADGAMATLAWIADKHSGHALRTTLDTSLQRQVDDATLAHLHALASSGVTSAAVVLMDTVTGEVLASVSLSKDAPEVDLVRSARSSGSTLKPFIYAAAFEAGEFAPPSVLDDSPRAWAGYVPANFDKQFRGPLTATEALQQSRNIPAMVALGRAGVPRTVGIMEAAGLRTLARTPDRYGLSLAIGGAEVTPLELAEAYATLARGGQYLPARFIAQGQEGMRDGGHDRSRPVLPAWVCWQTLHALADEDRTAAVCPEAVRTHVAWKTGTSSGLRDAWCAAATRSHTVVVWLGTIKGHGTAALTGAEAAAPLALHLVAQLPPQSPWPAAESPYESTHESDLAATASRLSILSPAPGKQIVLSPDDPPDRQRVELKAQGGTGKLWWFVDQSPAGTGPRAWWAPTRGFHELRLLDAAGHSEKIALQVR